MILFDFRAPSVNSFIRKRRHIGIRIIIYPDSKLSVLSIPTLGTNIFKMERLTTSTVHHGLHGVIQIKRHHFTFERY